MDFYTQVYFHKLGTPTKDDVYELGRENPKAYLKIKPEHPKEWSLGRKSGFELTRIAEIMLASDDDTGRVLCTVQHGDGGTFAIYVRDTNEIWRHIADYDDKVVQAAFGPGNTLFLISRQDAPRGKILSLELEGPALVEGVKAAKVFVPEGKDAIVSDFTDPSVLLCSPHALFVTYQLGGPNEIRVFDHYGHPAAAPAQLPIGDAGGMCVAGLKVLFNDTSYVHPQAWFEFDPGTGKTAETALKVSAPVDFDDCEVVREFATSKDGTKVPVNILRKKGIALDASHPCLVTAYGGYGVNITPSFRSTLRVFMDEGFVWAQANIRGGAEYGEEWHRQGALLNKQNVFDDFYAACKFMVDSKHTSPAKLAIEGGSNGGLLMGAALTQHPDAFRAVVSHVGIYDMLRVELSSNGAFNIPEFGTVKDEAQFKALYAYSPYHHVKDGVKYPSVIFLTGANDPRVDPMQSRKMTARLQAAGADALLRTSANSGHGGGTALSERIEQQVDVASWLFDRLGVSKK